MIIKTKRLYKCNCILSEISITELSFLVCTRLTLSGNWLKLINVSSSNLNIIAQWYVFYTCSTYYSGLTSLKYVDLHLELILSRFLIICLVSIIAYILRWNSTWCEQFPSITISQNCLVSRTAHHEWVIFKAEIDQRN